MYSTSISLSKVPLYKRRRSGGMWGPGPVILTNLWTLFTVPVAVFCRGGTILYAYGCKINRENFGILGRKDGIKMG